MRVPQVSERIKEAPAQALRGVFAGIGQLLLITDKLRNKTPADQDVSRARTPEAPAKATVTSPAGQHGQTATAPAEQAPVEPAPAEPAAAEPASAESAAAEPVTSAPVTAGAGAADAAVAAEPAAEIGTAKPATAKRTPAKPATAKPATAKSAKPATARRAAAKPTPAGPAGAEPPKPPKRQSPRDFDKTGNVRLLGDEEGGSALSATVRVSAAVPASTAGPVTAPEPTIAAEPVSGSADSEAPLPNYDELSVASLRARLRNLDVAQVGRLADYERAHAARAEVLAMFERRIAKLEAEA